eukprot:4028664-Pyramimonas_sp.AAC.1
MTRPHVGDFLIAQLNDTSAWMRAISILEKKLHLAWVDGTIKYCGRAISTSDDEFRVMQTTAATQVDFVELTNAKGRSPEDELSSEMVSSYRRALGQLLWLAVQTR